jgi:3-hydroxybutyryl-CoA dehydrogenase
MGAVTVECVGSSAAIPNLGVLPTQLGIPLDVHILLGSSAGVVHDSPPRVTLVELDTECLGQHTGESRGIEGGFTIGFARFVLDPLSPSELVELVRQPNTDAMALDAARTLFETLGWQVARVNDSPGRILNRLLRPYLNFALETLDAGLASADDIDTTVQLGLGYPSGPIALAETIGLAKHYEICRSLYDMTHDACFTPARRALVAARLAQAVGAEDAPR